MRAVVSQSELSPDLLVSLETTIGRPFTNRSLLVDALTHRSYVYEHSASGVVSNERLKILGDAVLSTIASDLLYRRFPLASEGGADRSPGVAGPRLDARRFRA